MSNFDSNNPSDHEWEDRGEDLVWNEFDWEQYLRAQDEVIHRYIAFYEQLRDHPDRIDEVAHFMGWDRKEWSSEGAEIAFDEADEESEEFDSDPYTLHKNPIFIATRAIYLSLKRAWECLAENSAKVSQSLALRFQTSLYKGEDNAMLAIQALDFGDYAMAVSLFKRALKDLNQALALLDDRSVSSSKALVHFRAEALPRLFDLREIWLRVMAECRQELSRPAENEDGEA